MEPIVHIIDLILHAEKNDLRLYGFAVIGFYGRYIKPLHSSVKAKRP